MGAPVEAHTRVPLLRPFTQTAGPCPTPVLQLLIDSSGSQWLLLISICPIGRATAAGVAAIVHIAGLDRAQVRKGGRLQHKVFDQNA